MSATTVFVGSGNHDGQVPRLPYAPALDGLRALAVIAVLLYHAGLPWVPGGFLGVEVFFVISGYLITSLLLAEWSLQGRIDFQAFWLRRARRLLPALFTVLLAVAGFVVVFLPDEASGLRGDAFSSAVYVNNWYQIFGHKSYFETVGRPPLLRHLWSLAVEEQFYLLWPLLFALLMSARRPRLPPLATLAGAAASIAAMAALYQPDTDSSRLYYGTDTRAGGLLLGAALAFVWKPGRTGGRAGGLALNAVGLTALGTLTVCVLRINEFQAFLYRGGFTLVGLATAALIAAAVHPQARLVGRPLAWAPLRWVGMRSYGIYLWHFPVFMVTRPQLDVPIDGAPLLAARLALTVLFAALSYRFVETPVRNGALGRSWNAWCDAQGRARRAMGLRWATASLAIVAAFSIVGESLLTAQPSAPPEYLAASSPAHAPARAAAAARTNAPPGLPRAIAPAMALPATPARASPAPIPPPLPPPPPAAPMLQPLAPASEPPASAGPAEAVTAVGDSVLLGVGDELSRTLGGNVVVDAQQGRQAIKTAAVIRSLRAAGKLNPIVIIHIGDNGIFTARAFDQIMAELKDARRVLIVNVKVPRNWEALNNAMLESAVTRYPNAVLVDWHSASIDRPKLFWKDGLHLRPEGARFYASLLAQAVRAP